MTRLFPVLLLILFGFQNYAQSTFLESELSHEPNVENLKILHQLTDQYAGRDSTKALSYARQAIEMSEELGDTKLIARSYLNMGYVYQQNFEYEESKAYISKAEEVYQSINDLDGLARVAEMRGLAAVKQGYHAESLTFFRKALEGFQKANSQESILKSFYHLGYAHYRLKNFDSTTYYYFQVLPHCDDSVTQNCIDVYNQLGTTYTEIKEYKKANDYLKLALAGSLGKGDTVSAGNATMNIAGNYFFQQKLDSCAIFLNKAISMYDATGNKQGQVIGLNNLSIIYEENGELENALRTAKEAIQAAKTINDRNIIAGSYLQVMDVSRKLKNMGQSLIYSDSAIVLLQELKSKYHFQQYYLSLSEAYTDLNDYKAALKYKDLYYAYTDSMLNEQKNNQIAELETKYETEKKEQEIELLNTEKELQAAVIKNNRTSIFILIALLAGLIVIGFWLFKRNQYKQRVMLEKERTRSKEEQIRAVIQSQEKERKRFAMDLHDDFGQLISALKLNVTNPNSETPEKSETILDTMYSSLKNIAFDLMPHTLFQKGLEEAIDELKDQINANGRLKVEFQSFDIKNNIDDEQKVAIYRIIQELVSNVIKYSNASKLNISITDIGHGISLIVEDNGDGFDLTQFKNGKGNGWKNIHSRLGLLHGEIEFDTSPGRKNTTVIMEVPYLKQEAEVA